MGNMKTFFVDKDISSEDLKNEIEIQKFIYMLEKGMPVHLVKFLLPDPEAIKRNKMRIGLLTSWDYGKTPDTSDNEKK